MGLSSKWTIIWTHNSPDVVWRSTTQTIDLSHCRSKHTRSASIWTGQAISIASIGSSWTMTETCAICEQVEGTNTRWTHWGWETGKAVPTTREAYSSWRVCCIWTWTDAMSLVVETAGTWYNCIARWTDKIVASYARSTIDDGTSIASQARWCACNAE